MELFHVLFSICPWYASKEPVTTRGCVCETEGISQTTVLWTVSHWAWDAEAGSRQQGTVFNSQPGSASECGWYAPCSRRSWRSTLMLAFKKWGKSNTDSWNISNPGALGIWKRGCRKNLDLTILLKLIYFSSLSPSSCFSTPGQASLLPWGGQRHNSSCQLVRPVWVPETWLSSPTVLLLSFSHYSSGHWGRESWVHVWV